MATLQLASWATNLTYTNLTSGVILSANKFLFNWAGCAIGGFPFQSTPQIALNTTISQFSGPPTSSIIGANGSISQSYGDAQIVALINGIASHVDDYDDTHLETIIHPAGPVASALLAIAEAYGPATGHDFITAFIAGVEAECKLGLSVTPEHYDVGWHITSTTGSVGAAVGVGKLLGLDTTHMAHAVGVAVTQVIGMQEFFSSDTKSFHVGRAAQSGIVMHPVIDAAIQPSKRTATHGGFSVDDIETVELRVNPEFLILTGKKTPETRLEAKFSIYHATAISLLYGEATPSQFTNAVVANTTVVNLRNKVTATEDEVVSRAEAHVTLTFSDGTKLDKHVEHAKGSIVNPLTDDELKAKFMGQVSLAIGAQRAEAAWVAFSGVEGMADVAGIWGMY